MRHHRRQMGRSRPGRRLRPSRPYRPQGSLQRTPPLESGGVSDGCGWQHRQSQRCGQRRRERASRPRARLFPDVHCYAPFPGRMHERIRFLSTCKGEDVMEKGGSLKPSIARDAMIERPRSRRRRVSPSPPGAHPIRIRAQGSFCLLSSRPVPAGDRPSFDRIAPPRMRHLRSGDLSGFGRYELLEGLASPRMNEALAPSSATMPEL